VRIQLGMRVQGYMAGIDATATVSGLVVGFAEDAVLVKVDHTDDDAPKSAMGRVVAVDCRFLTICGHGCDYNRDADIQNAKAA
jgi:hypothetical protein